MRGWPKRGQGNPPRASQSGGSGPSRALYSFLNRRMMTFELEKRAWEWDTLSG